MSDLRDEYPSNSRDDAHRLDSPKAKPPKKEIHKVIDGEATINKGGLFSKVKESFAPETNRSVAEYIVLDVVLPNVKSLLLDMITQGTEQKLYGGDSPVRRSSNSRPAQHTPYNRMYRGPSATTRGSRGRETSSVRDDGLNEDISVDNILLNDRGAAERVLYELEQLVSTYGEASVSDLYELLGVTADFVGDAYGWDDLTGARVTRAMGGRYKIVLPREKAIEG